MSDGHTSDAGAALLAKLKSFVEGKGATLGDGWTVKIKSRHTGNSAGSTDAYYFGPDGKRYRSRQEVARSLGLAADETSAKKGEAKHKYTKARLRREDAATVAEQRLHALQLPYMTATGVTVTKLGEIHAEVGYAANNVLWPVGFSSQREFDNGATIVSSIDSKESGPVFTLRMQLAGKASEVLSQGNSPDAAVHVLCQRQRDVAAGNSSKSAAQHSPESATPSSCSLSDALAEIPPLLGNSGRAVFGLDDVNVLQAIEGLPGVVECSAYRYVEEYTSWSAYMKSIALKTAVRKQGTAASPKRPRKLTPLPHNHSASKQQASPTLPPMPPPDSHASILDQQLATLKDMVHDGSRQNGSCSVDDPAASGLTVPKDASWRSKAGGKGGDGRGNDKATAGGVGGTTILDEDGPPKKHQRTGKDARGLKERDHIHKVMDKLLRSVEAAVARQDIEEARRERKRRADEAAALNEEKRHARELQRKQKEDEKAMRDITRKRARQDKAAARVAAGAAVDVSSLAVELVPPPPAAQMTAGKLPAHLVPHVVEVWKFLLRFHDVLDLDSVPSLQQLEDDLVGDDLGVCGVVSDVYTGLARVMLEDAFAPALKAAAKELDFGRSEREFRKAMPLVTDETWMELSCRYLQLHMLAVAVKQIEGSRGTTGLMAGAAGGSSGTTFRQLDWHSVLRCMLCGMSNRTASTALMPQGTVSAALSSRLSTSSASALSTAYRTITGNTGQHSGELETQQKLRACVNELAAIKGGRSRGGAVASGRLLCFHGMDAAVAAGSGKVMDLRSIAARVDAGVYNHLPDGAAEFCRDVRWLCDVWRKALKRTNTRFGSTMAEAGASLLPDMTVSLMESVMAGVGKQRADSMRGDEAEDMAEDVEGGMGVETAAAAHDVTSGSRVCAPFPGCLVCWTDEDQGRMLLCDGCDDEYHSYCLEPPLRHIPKDEWFCPRCVQAGATPGLDAEVVDGSCPGCNDVDTLVQRAAHCEYRELSVDERVLLLRLLSSMVLNTRLVRSHLSDVMERRVQIRRELASLRAFKAKGRRTQDVTSAAGKNEAADKRTRSAGPAPEDVATSIHELECELTRLTVREVPLGTDRHGSRYWLLGHDHLADDGTPGLLVAEQDGGGMGCYSSLEATNELVAFLHPSGSHEGALRESVLKYRDALAASAQANSISVDGDERAGKHHGGGAQQADSPTDAMAEELEGESTAVGVDGILHDVRTQMVEFVDGLSPDMLSKRWHGVAEQWKVVVANAKQADTLMASLVVLEDCIKGECLKPWWSLWTLQIPGPQTAGTLQAVRLRLFALQSALRKGSARPVDEVVVSLPRSRRSTRAARQQTQADVGSSSDEGDTSSKGQQRRASKRSASGYGNDDDAVHNEDMAKQLQAQLNRGRLTRGRLQAAMNPVVGKARHSARRANSWDVDVSNMREERAASATSSSGDDNSEASESGHDNSEASESGQEVDEACSSPQPSEENATGEAAEAHDHVEKRLTHAIQGRKRLRKFG